MFDKKVLILAVGSLIVVSALIAGAVLAQEKHTAASNSQAVTNIFKNINVRNIGEKIGAKIGPVITGNVTAIDGTTITIASKLSYVPDSTNPLFQAATYTVDASKATIHRINRPTPVKPPSAVNVEPLTNRPASASGNLPETAGRMALLKNIETTIAVSDIHIGDLLVVRGTVAGTNVVATDITVSAPLGGANGEKKAMIAGTVQAITGTTLTVLSSANSSTQAAVTYTVDASAAVVRKYVVPSVSVPMVNGQISTTGTRPTESTESVSDIAVGDNVSVQGTVSGTNIIAIEIVDGLKIGTVQGAPGIHPSNTDLEQKGAALKNEVEAVKPGLWAKITSFFSGLFGKKK